MNTQPSVPAFITHANLKCKKYIHLCDEICVWFHLKVGNWFCSFYQVDWWNLMKQSVTVGAQLLWSGRYGCNNGRYGCTIVLSYIEINKAVSQWLLTFNLCVSVTWPLTCAFHTPCTHTPEIIDMHRGMCDNGCNYLSMLGLKLNHVSKRGHMWVLTLLLGWTLKTVHRTTSVYKCRISNTHRIKTYTHSLSFQIYSHYEYNLRVCCIFSHRFKTN